MKKFLMSMCVAVLAIFATVGLAACGGNNDGSQSSSVEQSVKEAPVISNKPTESTLTITSDATTYQFETAEYDGTITWISTVKSVATISENGLLTMHSAGYTQIIAKDETTGLSDSVALTIVDGRVVETLTIMGLPATVRVGDEAMQLSTVSSVSDEVSVSYSSSNPAVATVSETGLFTPISKGLTTITATKAGTDIKASVQVEVLGAEIESIEIINLPKFGMLVGNSYSLNATCLPEECEEYEIEWSLNNTDVAVLDEQNNLIAIAEGECTITATVKGTEISALQVVEVCKLSKTREDFRFAVAGTSNIQNVGPTITFNNVDGEIVEYGEDQALQITTRGNNVFNCFTVDFGEIEAGNYRFSMSFKVVEGRHSGAMVKDSDINEFGYIMATTALGNDTYEFYFNQETASTKKFAFSAQQWTTVGVVMVDNIVLEKVDEIPTAQEIGVVDEPTFDNAAYVDGQTCDINGVYVSPRRFATELVDDKNGGKALKVTRVEGGYGYIALSLGDITAGNYTLTIDIESADYQAILQILQIRNENGFWSAPTLQDIKYGEWDTIFEQAEQNGNTYTLSFSVAKDVKNFAIALSTNTKDSEAESIIIDNVKLEKAAIAQEIDFESATLPVVNHYVGAGDSDFGKALVITSKEITEQGFVTEDGNTYYSVTFKGWNTYSLINFGTLAAGEYEIKMDVKLLSGEMKGRFITLVNGDTKTQTEVTSYSKKGDTYSFVVKLDKQVSEFCIGYRSIANDNANFTLAYDNISIAEYVEPEKVAPESIEITNAPEAAITEGQSFDFAVNVLPEDASDYTLVWSVEDDSVGEIDQNGRFTAKAEGSCVVTVLVQGTEIRTSVTVAVEKLVLPPEPNDNVDGAAPDVYDEWVDSVINP